jgi:hypothetical protein
MRGHVNGAPSPARDLRPTSAMIVRSGGDSPMKLSERLHRRHRQSRRGSTKTVLRPVTRLKPGLDPRRSRRGLRRSGNQSAGFGRPARRRANAVMWSDAAAGSAAGARVRLVRRDERLAAFCDGECLPTDRAGDDPPVELRDLGRVDLADLLGRRVRMIPDLLDAVGCSGRTRPPMMSFIHPDHVLMPSQTPLSNSAQGAGRCW